MYLQNMSVFFRKKKKKIYIYSNEEPATFA